MPLFVECGGKRILFDTGNNPDILAQNAKAKGIDLSKLDFVVVSHRHGDHMGGLSYVPSVNPKVSIAGRFAAQKLHADVVAVTAAGHAYTLASAVAEALPGMSLLPEPNSNALKWSEIVEQKTESWPIQYLLPGGRLHPLTP